MSSGPATAPKLLVSVRSLEEARAALAGGCDLLDLKEPNRGSLGAADAATIEEVCRFVGGLPDAPPVSVALGELREWAAISIPSSLPPNVRYAKLGLSHCRSDPGWMRRWNDFRNAVDEASGRRFEWIAVHYADREAESPSIDQLLEQACETGCRGLLIDTFCKDGRCLFDHVETEWLITIRNRARSAGLLFAAAGSLTADDLPRLAGITPDIIAVRGAVCRGGRRRGEVTEAGVREFRTRLRREASLGGPSSTGLRGAGQTRP